jgi:hypothetical protein
MNIRNKGGMQNLKENGFWNYVYSEVELCACFPLGIARNMETQLYWSRSNEETTKLAYVLMFNGMKDMIIM